MWFPAAAAMPLCGMRRGIAIEVTPADRARLQSIIRDAQGAARKSTSGAHGLCADGDGRAPQPSCAPLARARPWSGAGRNVYARGGGRADSRQDAAVAHPAAGGQDRRSGGGADQPTPPHEATHWTGPAMAKGAGSARPRCSRIWTAHGLQPHRVRTFKLSNDPKFADKLKDVVGLYIDPPDHAVVLSRR